MKKLEHRAIICLLIAAVLVIGVGIFVFRFVTQGADWATYAYNSHIFANGELISGSLYDVNGTLLVGNKDGKAAWLKDATARRAVAHAVGDSRGNVATGALSAYQDKMIGYNIVTGTYSITGKGNDITLTVNKDISKTAYNALAGRKGCVGVYNYKTGEILCMVSTPSFDPKNPPSAAKAAAGTFVNKFLRGTMTPGSIFKLVTSAAVIENYDDYQNWSYTCTGSRTIGGQKVTCTQAHGRENFSQALANSCNCAFSVLTQKVGASVMKDYVKKTGLTEAYDIDGITNARGTFKFPAYEPLSLAWAGIGQWKDQLNPCSMLVYLSAIAGDGHGVEPRFIHTSGSEGKTTDQMIDASTASILRRMMRNNVTSNYGQANYPGLEIYAKSGTAEVGTANSTAWFCGFIRNEGYPYAFIVCVENGGYGSAVAGPVANTVMQKVVSTESARTQ